MCIFQPKTKKRPQSTKNLTLLIKKNIKGVTMQITQNITLDLTHIKRFNNVLYSARMWLDDFNHNGEVEDIIDVLFTAHAGINDALKEIEKKTGTTIFFFNQGE